MESVVVSPVLELLPYSPADLDPVFRGYRHIALIEQRVQVAAKQQPVIHAVLATFGIGADVSGLQHRQRTLASDRASAIVDIGHKEPERSLPQTGPDQYRLAIARFRL